MIKTADRILDAAEARIRTAGYHGFSFRDIAADIGIKSASVHHHFPTKEALGAAVADRYTARFLGAVTTEATTGDIAAAFTAAFQRALREDGKMCLCGLLGAESAGLPPAVARGARAFFDACVGTLTDPDGGGMTRADALTLLARLEGGMMLSHAMGDPGIFNAAVAR